MKNDSLGDRMKRYEEAGKQLLVPRTPVLARIDGRAFHTFTRGCARPYDADLHACMWEAAKAVCADIQGCKLAYVQSDEISLLLVDYETNTTQAHFDYEVPKMTSTAAATASVTFLVEFLQRFPDRRDRLMLKRGLPTFDARFYNVPREDVANYFLWRQRDAERNSLTMQCQAHYSHKELHGKSRAERHDLLHAKGINWNDLPTPQKRGVCVVRESYEVPRTPPSHIKDSTDAAVAIVEALLPTTRTRWVADENIPIFSTADGRAYIDRFVNPVEAQSA